MEEPVIMNIIKLLLNELLTRLHGSPEMVTVEGLDFYIKCV